MWAERSHCRPHWEGPAQLTAGGCTGGRGDIACRAGSWSAGCRGLGRAVVRGCHTPSCGYQQLPAGFLHSAQGRLGSSERHSEVPGMCSFVTCTDFLLLMRYIWGFPYSFKPSALLPAAEGLRVAMRVQPSLSWVPAGSLV